MRFVNELKNNLEETNDKQNLVTIYENRDFAKTPPYFTSSNQKKQNVKYDFKLSCYNNLKENCRHLSTISSMEQGCPSLLSEHKNRL